MSKSVEQRPKVSNDRFNWHSKGSQPRIVAWWDIDVYIGPFKKRKMTSRPLKELERVLGHRLHVEGWQPHHRNKGVYKFYAYNYFDTADPALVAYYVLGQLTRLSSVVFSSFHGFKPVRAPDEDWDDSTIAAFYWAPPEQIGLPTYQSSGVLLYVTRVPNDHESIRRWSARPVVRMPDAHQECSNYNVDITLRIICGNKQDLLRYHLPKFQASPQLEGFEVVDVDAKTHSGKPNLIHLRRTLSDITEVEAVTYGLYVAPGVNFRLQPGASFQFSGERGPGVVYNDGIASVSVSRCDPFKSKPVELVQALGSSVDIT